MPVARLSDIVDDTASNIDLSKRPRVPNPDGSISTVRSMSFEEDGKEILVPTVVNGKVVSDKEAIAEYHRTGKHLGKFNSVQEANAAAQKIHADEAAKLTGGTARLDDIDSVVPEKTPARGGLTRPFSSLFTKPEQASVVSKIVGHEVPAAPEDPSFGEMVDEAKQHPISAAASTVFGLTGIPSILEFLKTAYQTAPDIARGLAHNPVETLRGAVGGTAEGVMQQVTPANLALLALARARAMRGGAGGSGGPSGAPPSELLKEMPLYKQMEHLPTEVDRTVPETPQRGAGKMSDRVVTGPPQPTASIPGGRTPIPVRETQSINDLPLYRQMELLDEGTGPSEIPGNRTPTPRPANLGHETTTAPVSEPFEPQNLQKLGPRSPAVDTRPPVKAIAPDTPVHEVIATADKVANEGNVEQAAQTIETKVKLTVQQFARALRDRYGSQRAGDMLYGHGEGRGDRSFGGISRAARKAGIKRLAPGESKLPSMVSDKIVESGGTLEDFSRAADRVKGEKGAINPKTLAALGGGAVGAAIGGTQGDTTEDRVQNAIVGGALGAVTVPLVAHAFASTGAKRLQNFLYTSILSSPQSIIKAYLGGAGGAIAAATEKIAAGNIRDGSAILTRMFSPDHISQMVRAFRTGGAMGSGRVEGAPSFVNKAFDAVNEPFVRAMEAGGVSREDAIRNTLSGQPTTELGADILKLWSRWFPLRLATTLFPRVGIQILERGLERSPAGLVERFGLQTGGSRGEQLARAAMGPAAGLAAYSANDDVPTWAKPYLTALAGVYALPVGLGFAVGEAQHQGKSVKGQIAAATDEFAHNLPFPQYGPSEALNPESLASMAVPNILRDVARARDPYERDTRGELGGRMRAKIPGLRETLPVRGQNVNIAGQPNEDRSSAAERFFNPASRQGQPMKDVPDRVAAEIQRLGVKINVPSFDKDIEVGKRKIPVPPDAAERSRAERRQFLIPQLEKLVESSAYAQDSDDGKKRRMKTIIERAEQAGGRRARANVMKTLRDSGAVKR